MSLQMNLFVDSSAQNSEVVMVEGEDDVFEIQLGRGCSCGHDGCLHYQMVEDLLTNNGKRYLGWVKSAMHKEVRRGDFERAYRYAKIWEACRRSGEVRQYIRKVWFEESRNVEGLKCAFETRGWLLPLYVLCRSPKDWTLSWDTGWMSPEALRAWGRSAYVELDMSAFDGDDFDAALVAYWQMGGPDGHGTDYRGTDELKYRNEVLRRRANENYPELAIGDIPRYNDEPSSWLMAAFRRFVPDDANFFATPEDEEIPEDDGLLLPRFRDYVFDAHTSLGRKRLKDVELGWERPMAEGIDLRWSGDYAGTLWRYLAHRQYGTVEVAWEEVEVDGELKEAFRLIIGRPGAEG